MNRKYPSRVLLVIIGEIILFVCKMQADDQKTFIAYSMREAQVRMEAAIKAETAIRSIPDLYYLGGITKPTGLVFDFASKDIILVGERDTNAATLTIDDWTVALRSRFNYPDQNPGVTIDPVLTRPEDTSDHKWDYIDPNATNQIVHFFAGVGGTAFGKVCYDSDWLMKRLSQGDISPPITNFSAEFDNFIQEEQSNYSDVDICSRYWFKPLVSRVNVMKDAVLLERFRMAAFTEVLRASINGEPVSDLGHFSSKSADLFTRSLTSRFDELAQIYPCLNSLRGLNKLAGLAKGLVNCKPPMSLDFYLTRLPVEAVETPKTTGILRRTKTITADHKRGDFRVSGGVDLMAIALRLDQGDATALRDLVLKSRRGNHVLFWSFDLVVSNDTIVSVNLPQMSVDDAEADLLYQQASFLEDKQYYPAALECYNKLIAMKPEWSWLLVQRGSLYEKKLGDPGKALEDYLTAAEKGLSMAQYDAGTLYGDRRGSLTNMEKSLYWLKRAVDQGYAKAAFNIAILYKNGTLTARDDKESLKWFIRAAELGDAEGAEEVARQFIYGQGTASNTVDGVAWLTKSAEMGFPQAQHELGLYYYKGQFVTQDHKTALFWIKKAALGGYTESQFAMGVFYYKGDGVETDLEQVRKWWTLAAENGYTNAQRDLGLMYLKGDGGQIDLVESLKWYLLAANNGDRVSQENSENLKMELSPSAISDAQSRANSVSQRRFYYASDSP